MIATSWTRTIGPWYANNGEAVFLFNISLKAEGKSLTAGTGKGRTGNREEGEMTMIRIFDACGGEARNRPYSTYGPQIPWMAMGWDEMGANNWRQI
jgi:hypothetical protein